MPVISITTDFGQKDGFVGTMKGVIWKICPAAQIADITHDVPPQDIFTGAVALWRAVPFFPAGSVHVAVVDPGVGTQRRLIIQDAESAGQTVQFVHLDRPEFWLPAVSRTFHGRDIFAPAAAHLACGVPFESLGTPFSDPIRFAFPQPERTATGWVAHITVIDAFGNLTTDLRAEQLGGQRDVTLRLKGAEVNGILGSYGQRQPGDLVSVIDSEGYVEIAVVNGSAAARLDARLGDSVEVVL